MFFGGFIQQPSTTKHRHRVPFVLRKTVQCGTDVDERQSIAMIIITIIILIIP